MLIASHPPGKKGTSDLDGMGENLGEMEILIGRDYGGRRGSYHRILDTLWGGGGG